MAPENKSQHLALPPFYFSFNPREEMLAALENVAGAIQYNRWSCS